MQERLRSKQPEKKFKIVLFRAELRCEVLGGMLTPCHIVSSASVEVGPTTLQPRWRHNDSVAGGYLPWGSQEMVVN